MLDRCLTKRGKTSLMFSCSTNCRLLWPDATELLERELLQISVARRMFVIIFKHEVVKGITLGQDVLKCTYNTSVVEPIFIISKRD